MNLLKAPPGVDPYVRPTDYDELYRHYYGYVVAFVQKLGIEPQSAEDVASEILIRFQERDFLYEFQADKHIERAGVVKRARFQTFLNAFVEKYVRHQRDRQTVRRSREPVIADTPIGEDGTPWVQIYGPIAELDHGLVEEHDLVQVITNHLADVPRRSTKDRADMPELFSQMVLHIRLYGKIDTERLQAHFGVSSTAIGSWLKLMRGHVADALEKSGWERS